eukprot:Blabericola_migrator_1__2676@NODE_175_length_12037_cov_81_938346_g152_i0_p6_GENE_NODE_175_length_12037_cov_81_938346_g152_i0NODE_175_length_12037_cov_81_938346_g152_i0_p6_ORF_typecomplete_len347_score69_85Brix/PF04427_18/6_6e34_NODE_175_length_12037_cov_81_938346_g152_i02101250
MVKGRKPAAHKPKTGLAKTEIKRAERKKLYENHKLPKMSLEKKAGLDLERLRSYLPDLKGERRSMLMARIYFERKRRKGEARRARREAELRGEEVVRQRPNTIDTMRRPDDTIVDPEDEEIVESNKADEYQPFYDGLVTPKLLISTCKKPCKKLMLLIKEFTVIFPNSFYRKREDQSAEDLIERAKARGYSQLIIFVQKHKKPYGVYVSQIPEGPTCFFRLTSLKLAEDIKGGGAVTSHYPELIMKNFDTRLGQRIGRHLRTLFPLNPEFEGRRVITFHNQRDYVFFRHYRYVFDKNGAQAHLQEIGPRFTLKLYFIQEGTLNLNEGKYEYHWRPDMQVDKKTFFI